MNAAIYRFAPYTGSLKIKQQTFCLDPGFSQVIRLSEDVYIIIPHLHPVKGFFYFFEEVYSQARGKKRKPVRGEE